MSPSPCDVARRLTATDTALRSCRCEGTGATVVLDRPRYTPPADETMLRPAPCSCRDRDDRASRGDAAERVGAPVVEAMGLARSYGDKVALSGLSLRLHEGELVALLGPNGAGKTTLLRLLAGLLAPTAGSVTVLGAEALATPSRLRARIGLIPSGDRSFYLRISAFENLLFFGRLHGLGRKEAAGRALEVLEQVGLREEARKRVGFYSHGMQKRLSVARALLTKPALLLVDEATHDLDPEGARRVRDLVRHEADRGAAVVWATQRLDEIRGLAERVMLLAEGRVRFAGTVHELTAVAEPRRHVLRLRNGRPSRGALLVAAQHALGARGTLAANGGSDHFLLSLADGAVLGDALAAIAGAEIQVLSCERERSEVEDAFMSLTRGVE
jgi:ABC-2 type transport system ATP-binding protein